MVFIVTSHVFVFGVTMAILGQLDGFQGAPVAEIDGKSLDSGSADKDNDLKTVVVFVNTCTGQKLDYQIPDIHGKCYQVELSNVEQIIKTQPEDLSLMLYNNPDCSGEEPFEYNYSSRQKSENKNLPFKPKSFLIAKH